MTQFKGILWDCDGVIMDSEIIACAHAADTLTNAGYPITTDEYVQRFCGQGSRHIWGTIKQESGYDIRDKIDMDKKLTDRARLFKENLKPIDGIPEFLKSHNLPQAIASGSEFERLEYTLKIIDLYDTFGEHIYSASLVENGKPAPDIFLYAADKIGVNIKDCLIIEDSENGVRAGKSAGATVFGFTGGSHIPDKEKHAQILRELGADLILHSMHDLKL